MAHSFVMNYETEEEAFRRFCRAFPSNPALLLDTYDTVRAVKKAIPLKPSLVRLDSGDRYALSVKVRKALDDAGLKRTKIFVSGDLNEFIIDDLTSKGAPIDAFGVGTELVTSRDDPALPGIYKIVETTRNGRLDFHVKTSEGKRTLPGAKQVYRKCKANGELEGDILALADENAVSSTEPLLVQIFESGRVVYELPKLSEVRVRAMKNLSKLPGGFKDLTKQHSAPVTLSERLQRLSESLWKRPEKRTGRQ